MRSLKRVRYVTKNYHVLQGLKQVPIGIFLLAVAVSNSGVWPWYSMWKPVSDLFVLTLLFGMYWVISVQYKRNFGQVQRSRWSERHMILKSFLILAIVAAFFADARSVAPVSLIGLAVAAWMFSDWLEESSFRPHYLLTAILLVVASLSPATGVVTPEQFLNVALLIYLGIASFIIGIGDHLVLRRYLPPAPKEGSNAVR